MLCMHDSGTHNSNAAHVAARINREDDDYDDDVEQFFLCFFFNLEKPYKSLGGGEAEEERK